MLAWHPFLYHAVGSRGIQPMSKQEFDAYLRDQIVQGEMTPEDAEVEWDFFVNGWDSVQNIYG